MRAWMFALVAMTAGMAGPAFGVDARQQEENKRTVCEFYEAAINRKDADRAMTYLGSRYIQHNQNAADGAEGLRKFILFLRDRHPQAHSEIRRVFAEGDYVILHVHAVRDPGTRGMAVIDIFRLEQGKIVEHWDVHEDILERPANANGMF
jgi:predicted SnoaL-like aldol condensation-catalyzing enzyme